MKIKRKISGFLLIAMLFSSCPVFASTKATTSSDVTASKKSSSIKNWNYTIYDANGAIKEEGIFESDSKSSSEISIQVDLANGITLGNGESVMLTPPGSYRGVSCESGTSMSIIYKLNRIAYSKVTVSGYADNTGKYEKYITARTNSDTYKTPHTDYYYGLFKNLSSDPVVLEDFYIIT